MCSSRKYPYSPTEGIGNSWGLGGSVRPKILKKCMKLNSNFQTGGGVPSVGRYGYFLECSFTDPLLLQSQKLRDINQMLKQGAPETSRKRALLQDDHGTHHPAKISRSEEVLQRKLTSMIEERQASASR